MTDNRVGLPSWLGWDDAWAAAYGEDAEAGPARCLTGLAGAPDAPARVTRTDRSGADVLTAAGPERVTWGADLLPAAAADPVAAPTTGDFVRLQGWADGRVTVESVLPRRTARMRRPDPLAA